MAVTAIQEEGHIVADAAYTLEEAGRRLGLGGHALREAQRRGLKTRLIGRRKVVLGSDLIAYITGQPVATLPPKPE